MARLFINLRLKSCALTLKETLALSKVLNILATAKVSKLSSTVGKQLLKKDKAKKTENSQEDIYKSIGRGRKKKRRCARQAHRVRHINVVEEPVIVDN